MLPGFKTSTTKPRRSSDLVAGDADIVIVSEKSATPEQVARARALQLPDHFYLYEDKEPCPGCLGCDDGEGKMVQEPKVGTGEWTVALKNIYVYISA